MEKLFFAFNEKLTALLDKGSLHCELSEKMEICIYFFIMGRKYSNKKHEDIAEKLLDNVVEQLNTLKNIELLNGLSGIALGIHFLIDSNYILGDPNEILEEIDNKIFNYLGYPERRKLSSLSNIHILYYLSFRFRAQQKGSENEWLYKQLIIQQVDNTYADSDTELWIEPNQYGLEFLLPQFLFVLSKCLQINVYNSRITKILKEITPYVICRIPQLHSNRMLLIWGMNSVLLQIQIPSWAAHRDLLIRETDLDIMINEFSKNDLFIVDGISSLPILIEELSLFFDRRNITRIKQKITLSIEQSPLLEKICNDEIAFNSSLGIKDGICGTFLIYNSLKNN